MLLLAAYLGDGCISRAPRTCSLRITLDTRYPQNIAEIEAAMAAVMHGNRVVRVVRPRGTALDLLTYSVHLPCLFPQAGPGKKHDRDVSLEPWQERLAACHPWLILRGLLWTDGCRFINRTGPHAYASWDFTNDSADIRDLFADACDQVGVEYRRYRRHFRVYRRESVHRIDMHAGVKR